MRAQTALLFIAATSLLGSPSLAEPATKKAATTGMQTGSRDRVYRLDAQKGTVTFGDGLKGKVPPAQSPPRSSSASRGAAGPCGTTPCPGRAR